MSDFYYPYSFIRTPDRTNVMSHPFFGDHDPSHPDNKENHSRYWAERYSGVIPVRLTTQSPLFITDPKTKEEHPSSRGLDEKDKHYVYDCMKEIPATAIKGMLSSAYEIITNSRYRVFSKRQHTQRLGYRSSARANLVPGRVTKEGEKWYLTLYTGTSEIGKNGKANGPLYAAWLPAYKGKKQTPSIKSFSNEQSCMNVTIRKYHHAKGFNFWSVEKIGGATFGKITSHAGLKDPNNPENTKIVSGYVVKTGEISPNKHDERFFFNDPTCKNEIKLELRTKDRNAYKALIEDYVRVHRNGANKPDKCKLGEHTKEGSKLAELREGSLVYVKVSKKDDNYTVEGLYPVQISRELYTDTPWSCLPKSLRPATEMSELSPADRLFGWVPQEGNGAWRGKVRITSAHYTGTGCPLETFGEDGKVMAILGAPKPAQARFYLGDKDGNPQENGKTKQEVGYQAGSKLRGIKTYLHHKNFKESTVFPEEMARSNQNRSIRNWIPAGKEFRFTIRFENMTEEELGGLLILLSVGQLENPCFFRLGYGKPLGLGSVKLSVNADEIKIFSGEEMQKHYKTLDEETLDEKDRPVPIGQKEIEEFMDSFYKATKQCNLVGLYEDFVKSGQGVDGTISYGVIDGNPQADSFKWFVANEKKGRMKSLPVLGQPLQSYPSD